jgi:hypothetical protein
MVFKLSSPDVECFADEIYLATHSRSHQPGFDMVNADMPRPSAACGDRRREASAEKMFGQGAA